MNMKPFDVYKNYLGIKAHFVTPAYDFTKYGAVKASWNTFLNRKDRYFFEKLSKKYKDDDIIEFLICNFVFGDENWVGNFLENQAEEHFIQWKRQKESLEYTFKEDFDKICKYLQKHNKTFVDLFKCYNQNLPIILKLVIGNEISVNTYAILDKTFELKNKFDKNYKNNFLYSSVAQKFVKYTPFVDISNEKTEKFRKIITNLIESHGLMPKYQKKQTGEKLTQNKI